MGTRATPGGEDHDSATPGRRSSKQLQQNALTRPRSGRRAAAAKPGEGAAEIPAGSPGTGSAKPVVAKPAADQRPRTRPAKSRTSKPASKSAPKSAPKSASKASSRAASKPASKPGSTSASRAASASSGPTRAARAKSSAGRKPSRTPAPPERGVARTHLVDETEIQGPSEVEVDVTRADLVAELEDEGLAPVVASADAPAPRSRREARQEARPEPARPRNTRKPTRPRSAGGSRRPPGIARRLPVVGKWQPQNRKAWGAAIATALVLLIPGTTLLSPSDPIVDGTLNSSNGNLYGTTPTLDATTQDALVPTKKPEDTQKTKHLTKPKQGKSPVDNSMPTVGDGTASPDGDDGKSTGDGSGTESPKASPTPSPTPSPKPSPKPTKKAEPKDDANKPSSGNGSVAPVSGLGWASGAFIQGDSASKMRQFANWRGRGMNVVVTYTARSNWTDMTTGFDWLLDAWKGTGYTVVIGVPPFPESGGSLSSCASGDYNDKWKTFARTVKASGFSDKMIIRLGWEFNGGWYQWKASNPTAFAACWRQVVGTAESIAPDLRWDWNVNRGPSDGLSNPKAAWPGDDYVDIVGVDSYDWYPGVHNQSDWNEHVNGDQGLNYWLKFARAHGKKMSLPEWGLYTGAGGVSGGDNPYYIKKMMAYFKTIKSDLAYESYFNDESGYIQASLFGPDQNPSAANAYKDVYSAG